MNGKVKMHRFPDGSVVDPGHVISVRLAPREMGSTPEDTIPARIIYTLVGQEGSILTTVSDAEGQADFARLIDAIDAARSVDTQVADAPGDRLGRDYFAAAALNGMLAAYTGEQKLPASEYAALAAYTYADAMIRARG